MRKLLLALTIFFFNQVDAQLPKSFEPIASEFFISVPFGMDINKWIFEVKNNPNITSDNSYLLDTTSNLFFSGYIQKKFERFINTDSITILIANDKYFLSKEIVNALSIQTTSTYYLQQVFYFKQSDLSKKSWQKLIDNNTKVLKKYFTAIPLKIMPANTIAELRQSIIANEPKYQGLSFFDEKGIPTIRMLYGTSEKRPDCYFIALTLIFSTKKT
jgi:hypothetical protein